MVRTVARRTALRFGQQACLLVIPKGRRGHPAAPCEFADSHLSTQSLTLERTPRFRLEVTSFADAAAEVRNMEPALNDLTSMNVTSGRNAGPDGIDPLIREAAAVGPATQLCRAAFNAVLNGEQPAISELARTTGV